MAEQEAKLSIFKRRTGEKKTIERILEGERDLKEEKSDLRHKKQDV